MPLNLGSREPSSRSLGAALPEAIGLVVAVAPQLLRDLRMITPPHLTVRNHRRVGPGDRLTERVKRSVVAPWRWCG